MKTEVKGRSALVYEVGFWLHSRSGLYGILIKKRMVILPSHIAVVDQTPNFLGPGHKAARSCLHMKKIPRQVDIKNSRLNRYLCPNKI